MIGRVEGKIAFVTGGGSGLGRAMCIRLAQEGAKVVVADVNLASAQETVALINGQGTSMAVCVDVTRREEVAAAAAATTERFGGIDLLVNNAGIVGQFVKTAEVSDESWDRVISVNLKSVFICCREMIPRMLARGGGVIINIASTAGLTATSAGIEYTAAKHGVVGMTKELAFEYGQQGIRAVAIAPGVIRTPMVEKLPPGFVESNSDFQKTLRGPSGRMGEAEEIAAAVVFLASDEAAFIHGNTISVDGGFTSY